MCGIAGAFFADLTPRRFLTVKNIVAAQIGRGPDFQTVETVQSTSSTLVLGHNRLSIIDLNPEANQPMWDHERRCAIVYNGEIYNFVELRRKLASLGHRFNTKSDTEVILEAFKAWGTAAFSQFNGMFAFALFDREIGRLWLVRDRFGVKPLFYRQDGNSLTFGSTMRPLAKEFGLKPNLAYCARGLQYCIYEVGDETSAYEGLSAIRPGTFLQAEFKDSNLCVRSAPYYDLATGVRQQQRTLEGLGESEQTGIVRDLIADAVRLRLRSDVPLAMSLSGGLDSSSVASFLTEFRSGVTGFHFGHPDARESEGPLVEKFARARGIEVQYIWPTSKQIVESFSETLRSQEAPFSGGSVIAQNWVYAAARRHGFKVVLGGQGSDESFMGYRKYQMFHLAHLMRHERSLAWGAFALSLLPMLAAENLSLLQYLRQRGRYSRAQGLDSVLQLSGAALKLEGGDHAGEWVRQSRDVLQLSLPTFLRQEDMNSMFHSIECRLPFMDYRLVELGLALSPALKLRHGYGKWVVRAAMAGRVPDEIRLARFRRGFKVSEQRWMREGLGGLLRDEIQRVWPAVQEWVRPDMRRTGVDETFSDARLTGRANALAEAVTLIWLGSHV